MAHSCGINYGYSGRLNKRRLIGRGSSILVDPFQQFQNPALPYRDCSLFQTKSVESFNSVLIVSPLSRPQGRSPHQEHAPKITSSGFHPKKLRRIVSRGLTMSSNQEFKLVEECE